MLKKSLIGAGIVLGLAVFVFGKDVLSYARTSARSVRNAVKSEVPLDFEVKRAREMVENLVPDIRDCMHLIAEQEVDVDHLGRRIARREKELANQKKVVLALRHDLENETEHVYAGRRYSTDDVRRDLASRFERFKTAERSLEQDQNILAAREKALKANRNKLDAMLASKQQLEVKVEQLEARLKTVEAAETAQTIQFDDTQLARAKTLIAELNKQLDVREKMLDAEGRFVDLIPVDEEPENVTDVARDIDAYFGEEREEAKAETAGNGRI